MTKLKAKFDLCVIGMGYIGLPTAAMFAKSGMKVLGVDINPEVVRTLNSGKIHIEEPGLEGLVANVVSAGFLEVSTKPLAASAYILAVPTPFKQTKKNPKAPDLSFVKSATESIAPVAPAGSLIILESTSPVGTTELVKTWLERILRKQLNDSGAKSKNTDRLLTDQLGLEFAHCPERILPGQMLKELVENDRICGGLTEAASIAAKKLYSAFCKGEIFTADSRTAELCKLAENASRDVSIAFANELSLVCNELNIDVWSLIKLANRHPRVKILNPGPGVGGHCIAVDPWFIVDAAPEVTPLMQAARHVNDSKPEFVIKQIITAAKSHKNPKIVCLGLTFKANVDDVRESPALEIVKLLSAAQVGPITVVEPHLSELPKALKRLQVSLDSYEHSISIADIIVLLVDHNEFKKPDQARLRGKVVIDTRGHWSK